MKSNRKEKTRPSSDNSMSSRASRLRSMDDDNCSVILRPIHHVSNVCLCYDDPADCTTCTQGMENSDTSRNMFYLDESEGDSRLSGGSSPESSLVSSSDGSSLFDRDFLKNVEDNLNCHVEQRVRLVSEKEPEVSIIPPVSREIENLPETLERKILELQESFASNAFTLGQMMTMHGYQTAVLGDEISCLKARVNAEKSLNLERIELIETLLNQWELSRLLAENCKENLEEVEGALAETLKDSELVKWNIEKTREIRKNLSKLDNFDRSCEFWTAEQREILDDVSTCQSFCVDDL